MAKYFDDVNIKFDKESDDYLKLVAEPFERGYATTIGNTLRRTLLTSIPGAAVTSLKIDGVSHEFSTIPGIVEDVTEIILNLKQIRLKQQIDSVDNETVSVSINKRSNNKSMWF